MVYAGIKASNIECTIRLLNINLTTKSKVTNCDSACTMLKYTFPLFSSIGFYKSITHDFLKYSFIVPAMQRSIILKYYGIAATSSIAQWDSLIYKRAELYQFLQPNPKGFRLKQKFSLEKFMDSDEHKEEYPRRRKVAGDAEAAPKDQFTMFLLKIVRSTSQSYCVRQYIISL
ncbi:hypothetical protein Nepgr_014046 [Nepenthes gracilis]|uniref:Uncharacterized protein n=1 Tax=Nepenthes gracilis TaxID=150966 RepID=A0AAD3SJZ2_NEPGR|nr:hypothetical protein Nepgr_014046 [Nepenthes gracilis]